MAVPGVDFDATSPDGSLRVSDGAGVLSANYLFAAPSSGRSVHLDLVSNGLSCYWGHRGTRGTKSAGLAGGCELGRSPDASCTISNSSADGTTGSRDAICI